MILEISLLIFKMLSSLFKENTPGPPFSGINLRWFFYLDDEFVSGPPVSSVEIKFVHW